MNAIATDGLGKRYGRRWALRDCAVNVPAGSVVGLVGTNGAGKSTLLHLIVGLLEPTEGSISVLGRRPGAGPDQLGRVGFLAQDAPSTSRSASGITCVWGSGATRVGIVTSPTVASLSLGWRTVSGREVCRGANVRSSP